MMFLAVVLVLVVGVHFIAKQDWHGTYKKPDENAPTQPMPDLSKDGEFNIETEREFQKIVESIKKEQQ